MLAMDALQNLILEALAYCGYGLVEPRAVSLLLSYLDDFFSSARSCVHRSNDQTWPALFLLERGFTRDKLEVFMQQYRIDADIPPLVCEPPPCTYPDVEVIPPDLTYTAVPDLCVWMADQMDAQDFTPVWGVSEGQGE